MPPRKVEVYSSSPWWDVALKTARNLYVYYICFYYFAFKGGSLSKCPYFKARPAVQVHIYSLAKTLSLFCEPHYRAKSFQQDILDNLKNVAVPGTGVPMHYFFKSKLLAWFFFLIIYPLLCLCGAVWWSRRTNRPATDLLEEYLLDPQHWFAIWRLNSFLVAYHSWLTQSQQYLLEDKGTFLLAGEAAGLPVTPFIKHARLVVKHKSIEGGMGIHFFDNFVQEGGEWIIQPAFQNSKFLQGLLPPGAPLSTFRIITASARWPNQQLGNDTGAMLRAGRSGVGKGSKPGVAAAAPASSASSSSSGTNGKEECSVLTAVFRAGRAGALTDHSSVCFNVDVLTGRIQRGISNGHWYRLGLGHVLRVESGVGSAFTHHPDTQREVAGAVVPSFPSLLATCKRAHMALLPDVPLVGWDVALTDEGPMLLELNISCNFFNGRYDREAYVSFMHAYLLCLEGAEAGQARRRKGTGQGL